MSPLLHGKIDPLTLIRRFQYVTTHLYIVAKLLILLVFLLHPCFGLLLLRVLYLLIQVLYLSL